MGVIFPELACPEQLWCQNFALWERFGFAAFEEFGHCLRCSLLDSKNQPSLEFPSFPEFGIISKKGFNLLFYRWSELFHQAFLVKACSINITIAFISFAPCLGFGLTCPEEMDLACLTLWCIPWSPQKLSSLLRPVWGLAWPVQWNWTWPALPSLCCLSWFVQGLPAQFLKLGRPCNTLSFIVSFPFGADILLYLAPPSLHFERCLAYLLHWRFSPAFLRGVYIYILWGLLLIL